MISEKFAIFTDLDDTLYNWMDVYAKSFQAMVNTLCHRTSLDADTIIDSFARAYKEHKSLEYSFIIQELDIWDSLGWPMNKIVEEVVQPARREFNYIRRINIRLFPNVRETLKWARDNNILLFALTMAPEYQAHKRLRYFKIDPYFECLIVFLEFSVPDYAPRDVYLKKSKGKPPSSVKCTKVFSGARKPDPEPILSVLQEYNLDPSRTFLIGDSIDQDVYLAQQAGIIDVWARYGKESINPQSLEIIRRISTRTHEESLRSEEIRKATKPTYIVDDFSQLKGIIESHRPRQLELFL